ncbi:MAG: hypothetical protein AAF598_05285 [Bacteroidota bacterium]
MKTQKWISKTVFGLSFFMVCLLSNVANATVYRVNNSVTEQPGIVYNQVTTAIAAASAGDTLYIEGSGTNYANFTVNKQLFIFGPGYFLSQNTGLQANPNVASTSQITIDNSGGGTKVSGMSTGNLFVGAPNCVLERNYISGRLRLGYNTGQDVTNTVIKQNFFAYVGSSSTPAIDWADVVSRGSIFIANNIIEKFISLNGSGASGVFINNTIRMAFTGWSVNTPGFQVVNNVITRGLFTNNNNNSFFNNIGNGTQFPAGNGNQQNVTETSVIQFGIGSTDGQFQIVAAGPAEGAGQTGEDCGAFGGADSYRLSGISSIPTIYELVAPSSGSNSIDVTISTRSNQ